MLRISLSPASEAQTILRLEGRISGRWVEELRRECDRASSDATRDGKQLVLDLAGVSSIDAAGLALFGQLAARSVVVTNCSLYVAELLKDVTGST